MKKLLVYFEINLQDNEDGITEKVEAGILQRLVAKLTQVMIFWTAGRPCVLYLWKLMASASFRNRQPWKLSDIHQIMIFNPDCLTALDRWWARIEIDDPVLAVQLGI